MSQAPAANASRLMLSRFRKGSRSVPGTYMSAAGIQTELTPSCLHKVAVHEAMYRRHVNHYRQDLEQRVDKLNKRQNVLKKSMQHYRHRKRENRRNRLRPALTSTSDCSLEVAHSKQMLVIVNEDGKVSRPRPIKRDVNRPPARHALGSNSLVSDSDVMLDFDHIASADNARRQSHATTHIDDVTAVCSELEESFVLEKSRDMSNNEMTELSTKHNDSSRNVIKKSHTENVKVRKNGALTRRGALTIRNQTTLNTDIQSQSDGSIVSASSDMTMKARESRSAAAGPTTIPSAGQDVTSNGTAHDVTNNDTATEKRKILDSWPMTQTRPTGRGVGTEGTQTTAFMQLVRLKQTHSITQQMNVIDKLISGSRNKRLVYLRRISEVSDSGLTSHTTKTTSQAPLPSMSARDQVDGLSPPSTRSEVTVPAIKTDPIREKRADERFKHSLIKQQTSLDHATHQNETGIDMKVQSKAVAARRRARPSVRELPSDSIRSSKDISTFIQQEKDAVALYGKNVTWQESLAKLKDVHYAFTPKLLEHSDVTV